MIRRATLDAISAIILDQEAALCEANLAYHPSMEDKFGGPVALD